MSFNWTLPSLFLALSPLSDGTKEIIVKLIHADKNKTPRARDGRHVRGQKKIILKWFVKYQNLKAGYGFQHCVQYFSGIWSAAMSIWEQKFIHAFVHSFCDENPVYHKINVRIFISAFISALPYPPFFDWSQVDPGVGSNSSKEQKGFMMNPMWYLSSPVELDRKCNK